MGVSAATTDATVLAELEQALTRLIRRGNQPRTHERLAAKAGVSLDPAGYAIVCRLYECGPVRLSGLAERIGIDTSTASRHVQQLEQAGLVARAGDPGDRRAVLLTVSERGEQVLDRIRQARRAGLDRVLRTWAPEERRQLATLLTRLLNDLETVTGEPS